MSSVRNSMLPPSLVSNLQEVLMKKKVEGEGEGEVVEKTKEEESVVEEEDSRPVVLVTNGDGIESPGLKALVDALVRDGRYSIHVCAPESDKSLAGHSLTLKETVSASSVEMSGATAYGISGTPADCVSLALSGLLFSWSKPALVISGIEKGSGCGHNIFYSGAVAGAREALIFGVPSISISLNWIKDESNEDKFKDAVDVCLPFIFAVMRDIEKGVYPTNCSFNLSIPASASASKGFKITRQSHCRSFPSWQAVSSTRNPASRFASSQQSLGIQLAQLGRDASAAAAARHSLTQRKMIEVESVASSGKSETRPTIKKYFRLEFEERGLDDPNEELDFRAVEEGFIAVTPFHLPVQCDSETHTSALDWLAGALVDSA